ncbi:putative aldouronate transport system permease protein [Paenibacillus sp. UNCCL117]|uniref:ABC transporter permease n=1 Tax=unclassified Paenibacillus TaxID=185978 RepID=UPI00088E1EC9|nr:MULTISPECIES: ABC transporter permease subunit [unclassified Paenibacillus]SDE26681.1 aldotetraouronic acid ABC transporter membrane protein 1 /aldotetraouronic acid ABC transporter membrane protein 1 [Paenibacillus sp. cl123]SFW62680.1 putative aldouronate transport system permease protein [Paenibacillus sp. UNCCL117]
MLAKSRSSTLPLHLMLLPGLILVFIYQYIPIGGIVIAFEKFQAAKGIFRSEWIGWENFRFVFQLPNFTQVIWNTVYISFMKIVAGLVVPIGVSLLLNEIRHAWYKRTVQTLVYLPHFLSWVILGGILIDVLSPSHGIVNQALQGVGASPVFFLGDNDWFPYVLVVSNEWKEFGFATIVYLAALTNIDPSLYEAAALDGASRLRQTWHVTLPGMSPIIILMATLSMGQVLNAGFEQVFNLYNPAVYESGDIIDTFVYRIGILEAQYGVATAIGLFKSVVSFLFISSSYYLAYRFANYRIF